MKKIIKSLLVATSLFTLFACDNKKDKEKVVDEDAVEINNNHFDNSTITNKFLITNDSSNFSILVPQNASGNELKTAGIVQRFIGESTGFNLPIINEGSDFSGNVISIGNTQLAETNNIRYTYDNVSGFIIKSAGDNIFLKAGSQGLIFAGYELLSRTINFDYFGEFDYEFDKDVKEIKLYNYDITEIPDFEYRGNQVVGEATNSTDSMYQECMRINVLKQSGPNNKNIHTSFYAVPYYKEDKIQEAKDYFGDLYTDNYYEWFSTEKSTGADNTIPSQLCYTRHPDELLKVVVKSFKDTIVTYPNVNIYNFSIQDNGKACRCDKCMAEVPVDENGNRLNVVPFIRFINKLAEQIVPWAKEELGRDIGISSIAYSDYELAPTKKVVQNGVTTYVPIADDLYLNPNIYMQFAPHRTDYQMAFDDPGNEKDIESLRGWSALAKNLNIWTYNQSKYDNYLMFYDTFSSLQKNYQLLYKQGNVKYLQDQGQYNEKKCTAFNGLRAYVSYKLEWNTKLNFDALCKKYFTHCYGTAAQDMEGLFDSLMNRYRELHDAGIMDKSFTEYLSTKVYPRGYLKSLLKIIDKAYEDVKGTVKEAYYTDMIKLESIWLRVTNVELFSSEYTPDELMDMCRELKKDIRYFGITHRKENGNNPNIEYLFTKWGV